MRKKISAGCDQLFFGACFFAICGWGQGFPMRYEGELGRLAPGARVDWAIGGTLGFAEDGVVVLKSVREFVRVRWRCP
jgi:hypothetical protein